MAVKFGLELDDLDNALSMVPTVTSTGVMRAVLERCSRLSMVRYLRFSFWTVQTDIPEPLWSYSSFPEHWPQQGPPLPRHMLDEAVKRIWGGILPVSWETLAAPDAASSHLPIERPGTLSDLPIPFGVSIPVRGGRGTIGLLCVCFRTENETSAFYEPSWTAKLGLLALQIQDRLEVLHQLDQRGTHLTVREIDCVRLAAQGKRSKEIAYALSLGEKTVNFYLSRARIKLKASNTTEAVVRAAAMGVLPISDRFMARQRFAVAAEIP